MSKIVLKISFLENKNLNLRLNLSTSVVQRKIECFVFIFLSLVQFIFFVKRKADSTIEQQKCKCHKKRDRFLVSKWNLYFRFSIKIYIPLFIQFSLKFES